MIRAGKLRNKYVTKQGYRCKDCRRYFIERDGFEGMTYPKEIIVAVLHLFVEGLSLSEIREYMYQHHGYRITDGSILNGYGAAVMGQQYLNGFYSRVCLIEVVTW